MVKYQINPKLIHVLTNQTSQSIAQFPTAKQLGGKYAKVFAKQLQTMEQRHPKNDMPMTCLSCGKKATYNVSIIATSSEITDPPYQLSGYFRCNFCNEAQWKESEEILTFLISALLKNNHPLVHMGEIYLFDGYKPTYATDGEEHYLMLIQATPNDSLLWNKFGNHYLTSSRADLAMAAFEKSIAINPQQIESHFSIAKLLYNIGQYKQALAHLHKVMLYAENYKHLSPLDIKELLANALYLSFMISAETKYKYMPLPDEAELLRVNPNFQAQLDELLPKLQNSFVNIDSFYPLANVFMGKQLEKIYPKPTNKKMTKSAEVEAFIASYDREFTAADIHRHLPHISRSTISKVIRDMEDRGLFE